MNKLNDNELIYLITENDENAKEILIKKYRPLILSMINKYQITSITKDDLYQEGLLYLIKAINTYNSEYKMSFNAYFTLLLKRRMIDLSKKEKKQPLYSDLLDELVVDQSTLIKEENFFIYKVNMLSDFEQKVYHLRYQENLKPQKIATNLGVNVKNVYNALRRIKDKSKEMQNKE